MGSQAFVDWAFGHYLKIAPPSFVGDGAGAARRAPVAVAAAA